MTDGIKSKQAHVLWRMIFMEEHRELTIKESGLGTDRKPLVEAGLVEEVKRKSPNGRQKTYLVLTGRAWDWAAGHLDVALNRAPKSTDVLQRVLLHLQRHLADRNLTLAEFVAPPKPHAPRLELATRIRDTYFEFTYGQTNVPMPIATLRAALPGIAATQLDAELARMLADPGVILYPEDNPQSRTPELESGALDLNGALKHYLKLEQ